MKITKEQLKQIIKEELNGDYAIAMQMVNKFNNQAHLGDVEADLQEDDDGIILYRVIISMGTEEIENLGGQVELERNIQSKINQLQSELSTRVDVFGDTIQIELQPKIQGIENLQSFLNDASSLSQEIAGGDVAQSDLPGVKESKIKITKEQLKQIIKEEITKILDENENIKYFAVISPEGKVFRVRRSSEKVNHDPQKAINLAAAQSPTSQSLGDFKVYEYAEFGGGVRKEPIFVGPAEKTAPEEEEEAWQLPPAAPRNSSAHRRLRKWSRP